MAVHTAFRSLHRHIPIHRHIPCAPPRPRPFQQFHSFCRVHLALLEVFVNCLSPVPALQSSVCRQSYYSVSHRREPPSEYCCPPRCCQKTGCDSCTSITLLRADASSHHLARFSFSFACVCLVCSLGQAHIQVVMHCEQRGSRSRQAHPRNPLHVKKGQNPNVPGGLRISYETGMMLFRLSRQSLLALNVFPCYSTRPLATS